MLYYIITLMSFIVVASCLIEHSDKMICLRDGLKTSATTDQSQTLNIVIYRPMMYRFYCLDIVYNIFASRIYKVHKR